MVYTKLGPFTNGSASPPINAGFVNGIETALLANDALLTGVATPEMFIAAASKDGTGAVSDWAPAISAAFAAGYANIELSANYYFIRTPITIPSNRGPRIFSRAGKKGSILNVYINAPDRGVIEYLGVNNGTGYNYAGFTMENVSFLGNDSTCHALWLQDVSYPNLARVNIAGFKGAGILLDNCEDGAFDIEIQDCGRTTGDYTVLADRGNNAKTTYSGLHFVSTTAGAHNNMLRFTGEIEQMKTSPYVWIHDTGASNLWFNDIHSEVREPPEWNSFDFLVSDGADCEFKGVYCAPTFRNGFLLSGYGTYRFIGGRHLNNIIQSDANSNGAISISNASIKNLSIEAWSGPHRVSGCAIDGDFSIDYAGGGPTRVVDTNIAGNVSITNRGSGDTGVYLDNCTMNNYTSDINSSGAFLRNSHVRGNMNAQSPGGRIAGTTVEGTATWNQFNISFDPQRKYNYQTSAPTGGTSLQSDIVWNSNPTAGSPIGWVCVSGGTPGTWKSFGAISA